MLEMKEQGYTLVGAEQTANSKCLTEYRFPKKTVLLLGYVLFYFYFQTCIICNTPCKNSECTFFNLNQERKGRYSSRVDTAIGCVCRDSTTRHYPIPERACQWSPAYLGVYTSEVGCLKMIKEDQTNISIVTAHICNFLLYL